MALDTLRGAVILSMVTFHAVYDLVYLYGVDMLWFTFFPLQELWRISISWTFIALAGWMTSFSRSNFRRAALYGIVAIGVWIATSIASVDTPVSFGIIYCMAASTCIWAVLERFGPSLLDRSPLLLAALLALLFLALYDVPRNRYAIEGLAWLGLPAPAFHSGDYYPLIPFSLLYVASATLSRHWMNSTRPYPTWMTRSLCPALEAMGRHSLAIYVLHQPIILLALDLLRQLGT